MVLGPPVDDGPETKKIFIIFCKGFHVIIFDVYKIPGLLFLMFIDLHSIVLRFRTITLEICEGCAEELVPTTLSPIN